jgi:hypothetical protein
MPPLPPYNAAGLPVPTAPAPAAAPAPGVTVPSQLQGSPLARSSKSRGPHDASGPRRSCSVGGTRASPRARLGSVVAACGRAGAAVHIAGPQVRSAGGQASRRQATCHPRRYSDRRKPVMKRRNVSDEEMVRRLRQQGDVWFSNSNAPADDTPPSPLPCHEPHSAC